MSIKLKQASCILLGIIGSSSIIGVVDYILNKDQNSENDASNNSINSNCNMESEKNNIIKSNNILDYDSDGYNREGFDWNGYDKDGYDCYGLDRQGFSRKKYNVYGVDRAGYCSKYYEEHLSLLNQRLTDAYKKMESKEFRYALFDSRVVFDETLRLIVKHNEGCNKSKESMHSNLKICQKKYIINDSDFLRRLNEVRRICNDNNHKIESEKTITQNKVFFVIMQVHDLLTEAERILL